MTKKKRVLAFVEVEVEGDEKWNNEDEDEGEKAKEDQRGGRGRGEPESIISFFSARASAGAQFNGRFCVKCGAAATGSTVGGSFETCPGCSQTSTTTSSPR